MPSLSDAERAILGKTLALCSEEDKRLRKQAQQRISNRWSQIANHLKKRQAEIDGLKVGSSQEIVDGVFEIDPKHRNVRKQPRVVNPNESGGETNIYNLNGKITVVDPVIVSTDLDGTWGMAADSDGSKYYFVLDEDGIKNVETGKAFSFSDVNTFKADIVATTNLGNVGKDKSGNNHMVATVVTIKS